MKPSLSNRMPNVFRFAALGLVLPLIMSSCATTSNEKLTVVSQSSSVSKERVFAFFGFKNGKSSRTTVTFRGLQSSTGDEKKGGLKAFAVGGLFIPGILEVNGLTLTDHKLVGNQLTATATVDSTYISVPAKCAKTKVTIEFENGVISFKYKPVYCNWVGIGNVISWVKLKELTLNQNRISGDYSLGINGTANGAGSGSFYMTSSR